jgi:hypothetical protein
MRLSIEKCLQHLDTIRRMWDECQAINAPGCPRSLKSGRSVLFCGRTRKSPSAAHRAPKEHTWGAPSGGPNQPPRCTPSKSFVFRRLISRRDPQWPERKSLGFCRGWLRLRAAHGSPDRAKIAGMPEKSMYDMDQNELQVLISKLERTVERLAYERPSSPEHRTEAGILKDAKQLLSEKRKQETSSEVTF